MKRDGYTLVEFVIAVAAGSAVALVIFLLFGPIDNWIFTQRRRAAMNAGSAAVSRMIKEIARVKEPGQITAFEPERLTFVDIDDNTVDFQLVGTDLMRGVNPLARSVAGLVFTYLDEDGNPAALAEEIRVIRVSLAVVSVDQLVLLESAERIRNLP